MLVVYVLGLITLAVGEAYACCVWPWSNYPYCYMGPHAVSIQALPHVTSKEFCEPCIQTQVLRRIQIVNEGKSKCPHSLCVIQCQIQMNFKSLCLENCSQIYQMSLQ